MHLANLEWTASWRVAVRVIAVVPARPVVFAVTEVIVRAPATAADPPVWPFNARAFC